MVVGIACVIVAQYLAYRDLRAQTERQVSDREISLIVTHEALTKGVSELENKIASLKQENAKLKVKPYDDTQRQLVQSKLKGYSDAERDLLRLLMHRGETEGSLIYKAAQDGSDVCGRTLERLGVDGMILMREDMSQANVWRPRFYRVNPHFDAVLRDLLYPRQSHASPRFVI